MCVCVCASGMRQGNDFGTEYRSAIYTYTQQQLEEALASKDHYQKVGKCISLCYGEEHSYIRNTERALKRFWEMWTYQLGVGSEIVKELVKWLLASGPILYFPCKQYRHNISGYVMVKHSYAQHILFLWKHFTLHFCTKCHFLIVLSWRITLQTKKKRNFWLLWSLLTLRRQETRAKREGAHAGKSRTCSL